MTSEYKYDVNSASAEKILPSFFGKEPQNNFLTGILKRSDDVIYMDTPDHKVKTDGKTIWSVEHFWAQGRIKNENTRWSIHLDSINVDTRKPETLTHLRLLTMTDVFILDFYWLGAGINSKNLMFQRCDDSQRRTILKHDGLITDISFSSLYFKSVSLESGGAKQSFSVELQRPSDLPGLDKNITLPLRVYPNY